MCGSHGGHSHSHSRGRSRSHGHSHSRGGCGGHRHGSSRGGHSHDHDHDHGHGHPVGNPNNVQIFLPAEPEKPNKCICVCTGPTPPPPGLPSCYPAMVCGTPDAPPSWPASCVWPTTMLPANCRPTLSPLDFSYVCPRPAPDNFNLEVVDTSTGGRNRDVNGETYAIQINNNATVGEILDLINPDGDYFVEVRLTSGRVEELTDRIRVAELKARAKCIVVTDYCDC